MPVSFTRRNPLKLHVRQLFKFLGWRSSQILGLLLSCVAPSTAWSQDAPGSLDLGFDPKTGPDQPVMALAIQNDGKILIGGAFTNVEDHLRPGIARLNSDGSLDESFHASLSNTNVMALLIQSDGKILVGTGSPFSLDPGTIVRLNEDGSQDPSFVFKPNLSAHTIDDLKLALDDRIMVRSFVTGIFRVGPSGARNTTFAPILPIMGFASELDSMGVQTDGKVLYLLNRIPPTTPGLSLGRVNTDGTIDLTFHVSINSGNEMPATLLVEPDDRIVFLGNFSAVQDVARTGMARLNPDGTVDRTFDPGTGANATPSLLARGPDGKFLLTGPFTRFNNVSRPGIARLNDDGSLDATFNPRGANGPIYALSIQTNGDVLIGGQFTALVGVVRPHIARLHGGAKEGPPEFSVQPTNQTVIVGQPVMFTTKVAAGYSKPGYQWLFNGSNLAGATATHLQLDSTGFAQAGGYSVIVTNASGSVTSTVAVLTVTFPPLPTGSVDAGPFPILSPDNSVQDVLFEPEGKALLAGSFRQVGGVPRNNIARVGLDGEVDPSFAPAMPLSVQSAVNRMLRRPSGELIIITREPHVRQLLSNGSSGFDVPVSGGPISFGPGGAFANETSLDALSDGGGGKILIGGAFTKVNQSTRNRIARLNADGSVDQSFDPGSGPSGGPTGPFQPDDPAFVNAIAVQPDGNILLSGTFTNVSGFDRWRIARLRPDGKVDPNFAPRFSSNAGQADPFLIYFRSIVIQPDDRILLAGDFTRFESKPPISRNRIARLNSDGTLDSTFDPGLGADGTVQTVVLLPNGKFLIGGNFSTYAGIRRSRLARIDAGGKLDPSFDPGAGADGLVAAIASAEDGRIAVGGSFTNINGLPLQFFAILYPLELSNPTRDNAKFSALLPTAPGRVYTLEYRDAIGATNWTTAVSIPGNGAAQRFDDPGPASNQRFYRVRVGLPEDGLVTKP